MVAVGRWVTFIAGRSINLDNGSERLNILAVGAGGVVRTFFSVAYHFPFLSPPTGMD